MWGSPKGRDLGAISQKDGEHLAGTRSFLGTLRKDLSFGPPVEIGKMRYMRVRTFRIKQGMGKVFEDGVKTALAADGKSHFPASFAFSAKLSYPGPAVIASDPAFWAPKPAKEAAK